MRRRCTRRLRRVRRRRSTPELRPSTPCALSASHTQRACSSTPSLTRRRHRRRHRRHRLGAVGRARAWVVASSHTSSHHHHPTTAQAPTHPFCPYVTRHSSYISPSVLCRLRDVNAPRRAREQQRRHAVALLSALLPSALMGGPPDGFRRMLRDWGRTHPLLPLRLRRPRRRSSLPTCNSLLLTPWFFTPHT